MDVMDRFEFEDGIAIAYTHRGSGPPVVMLHNAGASHVIWKSQFDALARHYHVYALDLFGYGASSRPADGYTLDRYTAMVQGFLEDRGITKAAFVGNCLGSAISLNLARRQPGIASALVLINPLTESTALDGDLGRLAKVTRDLPARVARAMNRVDTPRWVSHEVVRFWFTQRTAFRACPEVSDLSYRYPVRAIVGLVRDLYSFAALDEWPDRGTLPPVCTIWGLDNRVLSPNAGLVLTDCLLPDRHEWLEHCGHVPMLEDPEKVTDIIETFLREHISADSNATATVTA